jgi:diguanylate cyclase (GGDEF)-like protein
MPFAVLFVDLNNYKPINDRFGHDIGDRVLVEIGQRLRRWPVARWAWPSTRPMATRPTS